MRYAAETSVSSERSKAEIELAWIAGLFEGEGTVTFVGGGKRPYTRLVVCVSSTDAQTLELFQRRWPVPNIYVTTPKNSPRAKKAFTWRRSCKKAEQFLLDIFPFVRTERVRQKIALGLKAQSERKRGTKNNCAEYRSRFEGYKAMMHWLNRRGVDDPRATGKMPQLGFEG